MRTRKLPEANETGQQSSNQYQEKSCLFSCPIFLPMTTYSTNQESR